MSLVKRHELRRERRGQWRICVIRKSKIGVKSKKEWDSTIQYFYTLFFSCWLIFRVVNTLSSPWLESDITLPPQGCYFYILVVAIPLMTISPSYFTFSFPAIRDRPYPPHFSPQIPIYIFPSSWLMVLIVWGLATLEILIMSHCEVFITYEQIDQCPIPFNCLKMSLCSSVLFWRFLLFKCRLLGFYVMDALLETPISRIDSVIGKAVTHLDSLVFHPSRLVTSVVQICECVCRVNWHGVSVLLLLCDWILHTRIFFYATAFPTVGNWWSLFVVSRRGVWSVSDISWCWDLGFSLGCFRG